MRLGVPVRGGKLSKTCTATCTCLYLPPAAYTVPNIDLVAKMADVETTQPIASVGGDHVIDDGEEAESKVQ